jgi:ribosome-binding factor A
MKYMPEVRFRQDDSFDNYARIDALLRSPEVLRDTQGTADDEDDN